MSVPDLVLELAIKTDRIEAILWEHRMHESDCPIRRAQRHNALGGTYALPGKCDCWLREET